MAINETTRGGRSVFSVRKHKQRTGGAFVLDCVLLIDDVADPRRQRLDRTRLTTDERAHDEALVPFLADLARSDPHVAPQGLAIGWVTPTWDRASGPPARAVGCSTGLPDDVRERLSRIASYPSL